MKASFINECGPPENIQYGDVPEPKIESHQILVRMSAVAVNPIDLYIRGGANFWELPKPYILGCDVAGVVEQVGAEATRFQVGDRVWGSNQGLLGKQGTFSEYCAIDESWLYPTPDGVADKDAVACSLVGITAHLGLFAEAKLKPQEAALVQGGSGGVGSMVVQMAKAVGARVVATAGSDAKAQRCRELGADEVILYRNEDVAAAVKRFAPDGVDVVWETQREPNLDLLVDCLAERGRIIVMAGRDARPPMPVGPFYVKCASLHGFVMFKAPPEDQRVAAERINQWLADGSLRAHIAQELSLAEAAEAHRLQEAATLGNNGQLSGKIVLVP